MDQTLFSLVNTVWTSPGLDRWMAVLSSFDFWIPLLLVVIAGIAVAGCFKSRAMVLVLLVVVGFTDGVFVNGLKHWVGRPRPNQVEPVRVVDLKKMKPRFLAILQPPVVRISQPERGAILTGRSFPSGHTADNFAAAAVLTLFYRRRGWIYFLVATAVGYSRIYTGSHWPSDVLASAFLGTGLGVLGVATAEGIWRRWGGSLAPGLYRRHPSLLENCVAEERGL